MESNRQWAFVLLVMLSLWFLTWTTQGVSSSRTRWEYKAVDSTIKLSTREGEISELLNKEGADGWELVGYVPFRNLTFASEGYYIFKRPK